MRCAEGQDGGQRAYGGGVQGQHVHHALEVGDALLDGAGQRAPLQVLEQVVQLAGLRITGPCAAQHLENLPQVLQLPSGQG
ncbi:hypothetical protein RB201_34660 [Streptomyces sp. S1A(2023)]